MGGFAFGLKHGRLWFFYTFNVIYSTGDRIRHALFFHNILPFHTFQLQTNIFHTQKLSGFAIHQQNDRTFNVEDYNKKGMYAPLLRHHFAVKFAHLQALWWASLMGYHLGEIVYIFNSNSVFLSDATQTWLNPYW